MTGLGPNNSCTNLNNIDGGGNLQVSDGGVVRISGTTAAAAFGDDTVQILADGYSIQGSTTANDFTNLADAELKKLKEDGDVFTLKVGDEIAKSVVIAPAHSHTWAGAWTTDDTHHWHKCTAPGCPVTDPDRKNGYAPHSGGTATCTAKAVCDACAIPYGELAAHDFTGDYLSDADGHWHKCKTCTATDTKAAHTYDNDQHLRLHPNHHPHPHPHLGRGVDHQRDPPLARVYRPRLSRHRPRPEG